MLGLDQEASFSAPVLSSPHAPCAYLGCEFGSKLRDYGCRVAASAGHKCDEQWSLCYGCHRAEYVSRMPKTRIPDKLSESPPLAKPTSGVFMGNQTLQTLLERSRIGNRPKWLTTSDSSSLVRLMPSSYSSCVPSHASCQSLERQRQC